MDPYAEIEKIKNSTTYKSLKSSYRGPNDARRLRLLEQKICELEKVADVMGLKREKYRPVVNKTPRTYELIETPESPANPVIQQTPVPNPEPAIYFHDPDEYDIESSMN